LHNQSLFNSFWIGGLECSSHRLRSGRRLDVLQAARHDEFYEADFARLSAQGFRTIRSGLRWHRVEVQPGRYDFSSALPMIRAAHHQGIQIIWDICHYGWPDDIDLMTPEFVRRFAAVSRAFAHVLHEETDTVPFICPINEISFFSWGAGDAGYLNPFMHGRGFELKVQLARAAIEGIEAVWRETPHARIVHVDPVIHIVAHPSRPHDLPHAEGHRMAQYQGWDLIAGRLWPQIGGDPKYLDILGLNYYSNNQWIHGGGKIAYHEPLYRPFRQLLGEVWERYQRPLFIGETGAEDDFRPEWLRYVSSEVAAAIRAGVPMEGLCLYPIFNHPGWDNDRHCCNGLWDYADDTGEREIFQPLAEEVRRAQMVIRSAQFAQRSRDEARTIRVQNITFGVEQPRVCLFSDSLEASGMGEHMLTLAGELRHNHRVTLIVPPSEANAGLIARARLAGISVAPLEVRGQSRQSWELLRDFLRAEQIDIFHSHAGIGWEGHDAIYAAWFADVPVLLRTEHLPWLITDAHQRHTYFELIKKIDHLICVSDESCQSYRNAGIPSEKISTIRNGIAYLPPKRSRHATRAALGIAPDVPLILTIGRMTEQKGYGYLLDAVPGVLAAFPDAHFVWAGEGPLYGDLCARLEAAHLTDSVHMLGRRDDARELMAAADLFVLPSLFEGLPLVILEAMAAGTPIVATYTGGTPEAMTDGVHGALVPPGDAAALQSAIIAALQDNMLRRTWAQAGRTQYTRAFSAGRMAGETAALYRRLLTRTDRLVLQSAPPESVAAAD
jgi:glycosyltransferase involved in cell wall biosynthesis